MLIKAAKFVINVVPEAMANSITRSLAAMTQRPPISSFEREAMAQANRMSYGESNVAWVRGNGSARPPCRQFGLSVGGHRRDRTWRLAKTTYPVGLFFERYCRVIPIASRGSLRLCGAFSGRSEHDGRARFEGHSRSTLRLHLCTFVSFPAYRCHSKETESERSCAGTLQKVYRGAVRDQLGGTSGWSFLC